ncbi:MAG: hypothetical protein M0D57_07605 [Sphingobacteriales bacterium JAD_PAG50586_3]|nr:MAG: hypothetical protein M0D57_07605 [Sphingobacteriales bacterium JAD_PAG50586_3]
MGAGITTTGGRGGTTTTRGGGGGACTTTTRWGIQPLTKKSKNAKNRNASAF